MIREFWQEQKENKKKQKELKKQKRKLPKTREQKAYKIFGICFALFLIFGSIFYACRGFSGDVDGYSWDSMLGITDDMKVELEKKVNKSELIKNEEINIIHWSICQDLLTGSGVDIVVNDKISEEILLAKSQIIDKTLKLNSKSFGALIYNMINNTSQVDSVNIIETEIYNEEDTIYLRCLFDVSLSEIVMSDNLPNIFVTTYSELEILDDQLYCMNSTFKINKLNETDNKKILDVINKNTLLGLKYYTVEMVSGKINYLAQCINGCLELGEDTINIRPM